MKFIHYQGRTFSLPIERNISPLTESTLLPKIVIDYYFYREGVFP